MEVDECRERCKFQFSVVKCEPGIGVGWKVNVYEGSNRKGMLEMKL